MSESEKTAEIARRSAQSNAESIDKTTSPDSATLSPPTFQLKGQGQDFLRNQINDADPQSVTNGTVQMKNEEEEESLQMKMNPMQMKNEEEEESLQMKMNPMQMKNEEEEESLQMKMNPMQMKNEEEEESLQMKMNPMQMKNEEEEESLQMKMNPMQMKTEEEEGGDVMSKMESSFGTSFSDVNIHKESSKATDVGALAYTQGSDIHFAPGQFKPETGSGQQLIGHELTHVVQQREGRVKPTTEVNGMPVNDNKGLEAEADQMGAKAAKGKFER